MSKYPFTLMCHLFSYQNTATYNLNLTSATFVFCLWNIRMWNCWKSFWNDTIHFTPVNNIWILVISHHMWNSISPVNVIAINSSKLHILNSSIVENVLAQFNWIFMLSLQATQQLPFFNSVDDKPQFTKLKPL